MPERGGNGLAMRAGLLAEGLAATPRLHIVVVPVFGRSAQPSELVVGLRATVETLDAGPDDPVADMRARLAAPELREAAAALHPRPSLCRSATVAVARRLSEIAGSVGLVVVMRLYLAPVLDLLLANPAAPPIVIDVDDIESVTRSALGEPEEAERFARLESYYLPRVQKVLACSELDARELAEGHPEAAVTVVPNAVRPPRRISPPPEPGEGYDLLFVASLGYAPNAEAAIWLCEEVMPLLENARLALVGSRPVPDVLALAGDRVIVAPDVPDVAEWYARSRLAVAPLRAGGGTKIKVIEALAHGRPVVATAAAARGLEAFSVASGPVRVAADASDFARTCRGLLADPERSVRLGTYGRTLVDELASVDVVASRIESLATSSLDA